MLASWSQLVREETKRRRRRLDALTDSAPEVRVTSVGAWQQSEGFAEA